MKPITYLKIITVVNLLVATGFSITGIINPILILAAGISSGKAIIIFALYAGARTIPLAAVTISTVLYHRRNTLYTLAFLAGAIQLLDGFIGIYQHDLSKTLGPFVIAALEFIALYLTLKSSRDAGL
jgi:hypothetical protein